MPQARTEEDLGSAPLAASEGGVWYFTPDCTRFAAHRHRELELNLVTAGTGAYTVEAQTVPLRPGSALWLAPGRLHGLGDVSADFQMWVIVFGDRAVEAASRELPALLRMGQAPFAMAELGTAAVSSVARLAYTLLRDRGGPTYVDRLAALLKASFRESDAAACERPALHPGVRRAYLRINEASAQPLQLARLAAEVHLSPSRLTHVFTAQLGFPPAHYIQHVRVQRAVGCLGREPSATLLRAAFQAGFGSYVQFFRAFRAVTGLTPRAYELLLERGIIPRHTGQQNAKGQRAGGIAE